MRANRVRKPKLKVDVYRVVSDAVEDGLEYGWYRAHKYVDNPSKEVAIQALKDAVMLELSERINF